jgi:hypothetical protein
MEDRFNGRGIGFDNLSEQELREILQVDPDYRPPPDGRLVSKSQLVAAVRLLLKASVKES